MSVQAMSWVIDHSQQKGTNLLCLLMVANYADKDGRNAWPSLNKLAEDCRMSDRHIRRVLRELEESGELLVQWGAGPKGTHLFTIPFQTSIQGGQVDRGDKLSGGRTSCPGGQADRGADIATAGGADIAMSKEGGHSYVRQSVQNHPEPSNVSARDFYERFLAEYPKRQGASLAADAWKKHGKLFNNPDKAKEIIEGAKRYRLLMEETKEIGTKFVCQIPTWLNQCRWLEAYELPSKQPSTSVGVCPVEGRDYVLRNFDEGVRPMDPKNRELPFDAREWFERHGLPVHPKWERYVEDQA